MAAMAHCRLCAIVCFLLLLLSLSGLTYYFGIGFLSPKRVCINDEVESEEEVELEQSMDTTLLPELLALDLQLMERRLEAQRKMITDMERRNEQLIKQLQVLSRKKLLKDKSLSGHSEQSIVPTISPSVIQSLNSRQKSEFDLIPFVSFTKNMLYQVESGLTHRPEDVPRGDKKAEMKEVIDTAVQILNRGNSKRPSARTGPFTAHHLVDGALRTHHVLGTQYELYISQDKRDVFHHLTLFRPFAVAQKVKVDVINRINEWINLIVPLSGRMETFERFMRNFEKVCIRGDKRVHLTIVYFGPEDLHMAREIVFNMMSANDFTHVTFVEKSEDFSRGLGLFTGAQAWNGGDTLMFFCDVDINFDEGFLDRCRLNAKPGLKVYYPMVFSLYNPEIVYHGRKIPEWHEQLVIRKDTGYWRDFGYGMTCLYRSDFLHIKGFDTRIKGWGTEDVKLYRKFLSSDLEVVRAPDRGIFHMYHPKHCDVGLSKEQYMMCLGSKALSEASTSQLGVLVLRKLQQDNRTANSIRLR